MNTRPAAPTDANAFTHRPWAQLLDRALGQARDVPTMLSMAEQKLYFWLTGFWASGEGDIVDLGCFAGGSTARLAEGHRVAGLSSKIHAYDRFTADENVKKSILYAQGWPPFDGNDILPLAQQALSPWTPNVMFHQGEIDQLGWKGGAIELLVMDASKTAKTADAMARDFFPHLIPGRSLVVQQDYLHWSQPWVPAQMESLEAHFQPLAFAPRDTVVFLCMSAPDMSTLEKAQVASLSDVDLQMHISGARARCAQWKLDDRFDEMSAGLRANPGQRRAFKFRRP